MVKKVTGPNGPDREAPSRRYSLVIVLSGPRGNEPDENLNYGRIECGARLAKRHGARLIISGNPTEHKQLEAEFALVKELNSELMGVEHRIHAVAPNTLGNVCHALAICHGHFNLACRDDGGNERLMAVVSDLWHIEPRVRKNTEKMQSLLVRFSRAFRGWGGKFPVKIDLVGIETRGVNPDFYDPIAKSQRWGPGQADYKQLARWERELKSGRVPDDLPDLIKRFFNERDLAFLDEQSEDGDPTATSRRRLAASRHQVRRLAIATG